MLGAIPIAFTAAECNVVPVNALRIPLVFFALVLFLWPGKSHGALVVDWGGNYVSADQALQAGGFSGGEPLILSPGASYSGTSSTFYGAIAITGSRTRQTLIQNQSTADRIQLKFTDGGTGTGAALVLWKQEDFLGGLDTGNVGFNSTDTISIDLATYAQFQPGRLVIQQGSSYYVSQSVFSSTAATITVNPTSLQWFNYDPTGWNATNSSTLSTIGSAATPVSGGVLSGVTEIGFLFSSNDSSSNAVRISNFEVNMSAIPEPTSAALLAGGLVALCGRRRRD